MSNPNNIEIEKKYLLKNLPENLVNYESHLIAQGYISREPVVRIRRWDNDFILTIKSKGFSHIEVEKYLTEDEYNSLSQMVIGHTIEKTRYIIPLSDYGYSDLNLELDIFHGYLEGLTLAEVEFPSIEKAESFIAPDFISEDVTNDPQYYNSNLSSLKV